MYGVLDYYSGLRTNTVRTRAVSAGEKCRNGQNGQRVPAKRDTQKRGLSRPSPVPVEFPENESNEVLFWVHFRTIRYPFFGRSLHSR